MPPGPACSSPPSLNRPNSSDTEKYAEGWPVSANLTMTPTVNNRTCQPAESVTTSGGSGSRSTGYDDDDNDAACSNASPPLDIMIPKTLDFCEHAESDDKGDDLEEYHRRLQSEQRHAYVGTAGVEAAGNEDEDESSFEATTSSWASSTIPSVVRFTSELTQTTAQGVAEAGSNLILRIPAAVRLSTTSKNSRQVIRHRDLIKAVDYSANLTTDSVDGSARYLASPVTVGDDDHPSISSHEHLMRTPESRFRKRHSHPELDLKDNPKDSDDATDSFDDDDNFCNTNEDDESLIRKLPKSYHYNPNYDDTAEVLLHTIDWEWIPYWKLPRLVSPLPMGDDEVRRNIELAQDHITARLGELDTLNLQVTRRLMYNIQPHQELLEEANGTVHLLAQNLSLSQIYVQRCLESLRHAARGKDGSHGSDGMQRSSDADGGLLSGVALLDAWDQKQDYKGFCNLLESVGTAMELERELNQRVASFDIRKKSSKLGADPQESPSPLEECRSILDLAQELRSRIESPTSVAGFESGQQNSIQSSFAGIDDNVTSGLCRLECLESLRERVRQIPMDFMKRLRWWLAAVAIQSCRCVEASLSLSKTSMYPTGIEYDTLVQTLLHVNQRHQHLKPVLNPATRDDAFAKSWSESLLSAFLFEANRAFCLALLDPTGHDDDVAANLAEGNVKNQNGCGHEDDNADEEWLLILEEFHHQVLTSDNVWEDGEKLRTLAYSLVTIRFDWEITFSKNRGQGHFYCHLAPIYHRLCFLLTNILSGYCSMQKWHERNVALAVREDNVDIHPSAAVELKTVMTHLENCRILVWNNCVQVLEQCLDEYIKYVGKKPLFEWKQRLCEPQCQDSPAGLEPSTWVQHDSTWWEDLDGLQDVARLTEQFCSLRNEFLSGTHGSDAHEETGSKTIANEGVQLRDKLHTLMKKHLRTVHVEAMNGLGAILSKEDWTLVPLQSASTMNSRKRYSIESHKSSGQESSAIMIQDLLLRALKLPMTDSRYPPVHRRSWQNRFCLRESDENHLSRIDTRGNPFELEQVDGSSGENMFLHSSFPDVESIMQISLRGGEAEASASTTMNSIYEMILSYCGSNDPRVSNMVPKCVCDGVFAWVSRLLMVMQRLPRVAEDAHKAFGNIFDLYATTVFRICVGSSISERIVLGIDSPSKSSHIGAIAAASSQRTQGTSSPLFGFRRMSGRATPVKMSATARAAPTISAHIEAELCAPLICELNELTPLRVFIMKAHENLQNIVKLDLADHWVMDPLPTASDTKRSFAEQVARVLEKRQAASWSCLFVAAGLHLSSLIATSLLSQTNKDSKCAISLGELRTYVRSFVSASLKLVSLSNRVSCLRAIRARQIVQEVRGHQALVTLHSPAAPVPCWGDDIGVPSTPLFSRRWRLRCRN